MRILLSGISGFLGSAIGPALSAAGHDVWADDLRLSWQAAADYKARSPRERVIVHLAANTRDEGDWYVNVWGTAQMVAALPPGGRFVFASSIAAPAARDGYEQNKLLAEGIIQARPDIEAVILRCANVFGPGPRNQRTVLNQIIRQAVAGEPIRLYLAAGGIRDYVFLDNVVSAFLLALDAPPGTYDVGTGTAHSLVNATWEVCRQTGHPGPTIGELTYSHAPLALESRWLPGWKPTVTLEPGIARTVAALRAQESRTQEQPPEAERKPPGRYGTGRIWTGFCPECDQYGGRHTIGCPSVTVIVR